MNSVFPTWAGMALALLAAGCASVAPAALDEANYGVSLSTELQKQLDLYHANQQGLAQVRAAAVARERQAAIDESQRVKLQNQLDALTAPPERVQLQTQLLALAQLKARTEADAATASAGVASLGATLAAPLPARSRQLDAARTALAALGVDPSQAEKREAFKDFAKGLQKEYADAKAAAASAPASGAHQ